MMLFQAITLYITILKTLCSQSNFNIHVNSHTTLQQQFPHVCQEAHRQPKKQCKEIIGIMVLDFTYIPETWKWQITCVRENQIYFGCFHGKTELNILCLDPTAESKWIENSQLFLSWAKCAICSHKVHLLVATVLQHYHKVPCDQGLVYKSRKILRVTESNTQDSRKNKNKNQRKTTQKNNPPPPKKITTKFKQPYQGPLLIQFFVLWLFHSGA